MAQPVETTTILDAQQFWNRRARKYIDTDKHTDATKRIISPASRSINMSASLRETTNQFGRPKQKTE